jgi:hypothetical protein
LQYLQTGWDEGWGLGLGGLTFFCGIQKLLHVTGGAKQHMACELHAEEGPAEHFPGRMTRHSGQKHAIASSPTFLCWLGGVAFKLAFFINII